MTLNKLDLVVELEEILQECDGYPFGDCDPNYPDYPWELVTAQHIENGQFTIENFLLWLEFIEPVTWEEFKSFFEFEIDIYEAQYPKMVKKYRDFIDLLSENLQDIQGYRIKLEGINEDTEEDRQLDDAYCLIGKTNDNLWLGIAPCLEDFNYHIQKTPKQFQIINNKKPDRSTSNFISQLKLYLKDFQMPNNYIDSVMDEYVVEITESRQTILEKLLDSGGYIRATEFNKGTNYKTNSKLGQLIIDNLLDVREYNIWEHDGFFIYRGGKTEDGDWIGLYTREIKLD